MRTARTCYSLKYSYEYEMAVPVSASDSLTVPTSMGAALSAYANGRES